MKKARPTGKRREVTSSPTTKVMKDQWINSSGIVRSAVVTPGLKVYFIVVPGQNLNPIKIPLFKNSISLCVLLCGKMKHLLKRVCTFFSFFFFFRIDYSEL